MTMIGMATPKGKYSLASGVTAFVDLKKVDKIVLREIYKSQINFYHNFPTFNQFYSHLYGTCVDSNVNYYFQFAKIDGYVKIKITQAPSEFSFQISNNEVRDILEVKTPCRLVDLSLLADLNRYLGSERFQHTWFDIKPLVEKGYFYAFDLFIRQSSSSHFPIFSHKIGTNIAMDSQEISRFIFKDTLSIEELRILNSLLVLAEPEFEMAVYIIHHINQYFGMDHGYVMANTKTIDGLPIFLKEYELIPEKVIFRDSSHILKMIEKIRGTDSVKGIRTGETSILFDKNKKIVGYKTDVAFKIPKSVEKITITSVIKKNLKEVKKMFEQKTKVKNITLRPIHQDILAEATSVICDAMKVSYKEKNGDIFIYKIPMLPIKATPESLENLLISKIQGKEWDTVKNSKAVSIINQLSLLDTIEFETIKEKLEDLL